MVSEGARPWRRGRSSLLSQGLQPVSDPCLTFASTCIGRRWGYGMVVDGFAKFQALNFGISRPEIWRGFFLLLTSKTRDFTRSFRP